VPSKRGAVSGRTESPRKKSGLGKVLDLSGLWEDARASFFGPQLAGTSSLLLIQDASDEVEHMSRS